MTKEQRQALKWARKEIERLTPVVRRKPDIPVWYARGRVAGLRTIVAMLSRKEKP
jgi:hypothetical protein